MIKLKRHTVRFGGCGSMKMARNTNVLNILIICLLAVLVNDYFAKERIVEQQRAIVFWNGVNGCKPSQKSGFDYLWQENAQNLRLSLENYPGEIAEPFGIMARQHEAPSKLAADLGIYLRKCQDQGKVPLIVLSPRLNIEGYMATLNPDKMNLFTIHGEATAWSDIRWTRSVTPLILSKLAAGGYAIDGYAYSGGGTMVVEGMQSGDVKLQSLTPMNARAQSDSFETLREKGLVGALWRITTQGDALTYPGKAAFGKGDIFIKHAEMEGWEALNPISAMTAHHNVVLSPGSTPLTVEVGGQTVRTDLRTILRHEVHNSVAGSKSKESGVSMKMDVRQEAVRKDEAGRLDALKTEALENRPYKDSLSWSAHKKEDDK